MDVRNKLNQARKLEGAMGTFNLVTNVTGGVALWECVEECRKAGGQSGIGLMPQLE
jgi:hypothetical protein